MRRMSIQSACIQKLVILICKQILIFTYAYALNFINRRFGSLFWLLGVPIGSLFHKKLGPYFIAWGSLLVFGTVLWAFEQINYGLRLCFMSSLTDKFDSLSTCCQNTENRDPSFKVLIPQEMWQYKWLIAEHVSQGIRIRPLLMILFRGASVKNTPCTRNTSSRGGKLARDKLQPFE